MNCKEFETAWLEVKDGSHLPVSMEEHRQGCPSCSEMVEDLDQIAQLARQLVTFEQPSERVWEHIRSALEKEGLTRQPEPQRRPARLPAFSWFGRLPMGLAYASVFVAALGVVQLYSLLTQGVPPLASPPPVPMAAVKTAPGSAERDQALRQLLEKIAPEKRAAYETGLDGVNSSIEQLEIFVETHPEDPFARSQLFNAYQQKERLWESAVRWEEF